MEFYRLFICFERIIIHEREARYLKKGGKKLVLVDVEKCYRDEKFE